MMSLAIEGGIRLAPFRRRAWKSNESRSFKSEKPNNQSRQV